MGEKPFRATQLEDGIVRGHNIPGITALPNEC